MKTWRTWNTIGVFAKSFPLTTLNPLWLCKRRRIVGVVKKQTVDFSYLDIINSSNIINGDSAISRLVQLVERLSNHALPCIRHGGLEDRKKIISLIITVSVYKHKLTHKWHFWVTIGKQYNTANKEKYGFSVMTTMHWPWQINIKLFTKIEHSAHLSRYALSLTRVYWFVFLAC